MKLSSLSLAQVKIESRQGNASQRVLFWCFSPLTQCQKVRAVESLWRGVESHKMTGSDIFLVDDQAPARITTQVRICQTPTANFSHPCTLSHTPEKLHYSSHPLHKNLLLISTFSDPDCLCRGFWTILRWAKQGLHLSCPSFSLLKPLQFLHFSLT